MRMPMSLARAWMTLLSVFAVAAVLSSGAAMASAAPKGIAEVYGSIGASSGTGPGEFGTNRLVRT